MIVIVGGGYAGAATAWSLARRGHASRVTLIETEAEAAAHASGRNAGLIVNLLEEDPAQLAMSVLGARLLGQWSAAGGVRMRRCGSLQLVPDEDAAERVLERSRQHDVPVSVKLTEALARDIQLLEGAPSPLAIACPTDASLDPALLAKAYLGVAREAGARVLLGARLTGIIRQGDRVTGVETTAGVIEAEWVVNAAGAWAGQIGLLAGASDMGLVPYRRHLFFTVEAGGLDPQWPFVWDVPHEVYYRLDGKRVALSGCDEEPYPAAPPEISPAAAGDLARKLELALPVVATLKIASTRACLRTFAPDRRHLIGPDPTTSGLFWVAGLGGSGATASAAAGDLAADLLLGAQPRPDLALLAAAFDPSRLAATQATAEG